MIRNKRQLYLGILGLLLVLGVGGYVYMNRPHRNIAKEEASFTLTADELEANFSTAEPAQKLADQVVNTQGKITALDGKSLTLDQKVEVSFVQKLPPGLEIGSKVTIKGRCVGYDDLLQMVKVDQAVLLKQF